MPDLDVLLALAPHDLPTLRDGRYDGGGFGVPLAAFAPEDQVLLHRVYGAIKGLCDLGSNKGEQSNPAHLRAAVLAFESDAFVAEARALGNSTIARGGVGPLIHKVLHDVRGGGLHILIGTAALLSVGVEEGDALRTCVSLARDHARIMRSVITDIDPPVQEIDRAHRPHSVLAYRDKWDGTIVRVDGRKVTITVVLAYQGSVAANCLETTAIDRILYNYLHNAAKFAADERVLLTIFPIPGSNLVRWVTTNTLTADHREWLTRETGGDLRRLYAGGLTRDGNGVGLTNCADLLATVFGLATPAEAVTGGYLGAGVVGDRYYAWFHWPSYENLNKEK